MWRQMMVDQAYVDRMRQAVFGVLLRANALSLAIFGALTIAFVAAAVASQDWVWAIVVVIMLALPVWSIWRMAVSLANRAPRGSMVAYAVTPDGTFHVSSALGTETVNPGYVLRVVPTTTAWVVFLANGLTVPVPRELLTDEDVRTMSRTALRQMNA